MPAKLVNLEYLSFSSLLHRNMPDQLNNSHSNEVYEVSNNNFFDLLYVFDRQNLAESSSVNEIQILNRNRLELRQNNNLDNNEWVIDDNLANKTGSEEDKLRFHNLSSQKNDNLSKKSNLKSAKDRSTDKNDDLENELSSKKQVRFSPAFINGKNYKPISGLHKSLLYNGSKFVGYQKTKSNCYNVEVTIQYVDLDNLYICGHFKIKGLSEDHPTLATFFDGEIISEQHPFLTRKYEANCNIDKKHWRKFKQFDQFSTSLFSENDYDYNYDYSKIRNSNFMFMRWKEHHLVNDHKTCKLNGISFDGFYYILFSKKEGSIEGYYFHTKSEWYTFLSLKHLHERTSKVCEFR